MFWRSLLNDEVKFSYFRFWRQHGVAAVNLSFFAFTWKPFVPSKRKCSLKVHKIIAKDLTLTQSSILMWRFRCSCRRSFLNSLIINFLLRLNGNLSIAQVRTCIMHEWEFQNNSNSNNYECNKYEFRIGTRWLHSLTNYHSNTRTANILLGSSIYQTKL